MLSRDQRIARYLELNPDRNLRRHEILRVYSEMAHRYGGWTPTEREMHRTFNEVAPTLGFKPMSLSRFRDHLDTLRKENHVDKINNLIIVPRSRWLPPKDFPARQVKVCKPKKPYGSRQMKKISQPAMTV